MEIRLGSSYFQLGRKIGSGAFGDIHIATNRRTGTDVAIKLEHAQAKNQRLVYEAMLYRLLAGGKGVANVHWYGVVGDLNVLVMDLLGPSLEDLLAVRRSREHRGLGLEKTVALSLQVLDRVEYMHCRNLVHRDLKPENFLLGIGEAAKLVHIIDFGLAKKYRDPKTHQHVPAREGVQPAGNSAFASLAADSGHEQSRRDDLEALGHMLVYLLRGRLPWLGAAPRGAAEGGEEASAAAAAAAAARGGEAAGCRQRRLLQQHSPEALVAKKRATSVEVLCRHCPPEFAAFLRYCRGLRFDEQPDYAHLRRLLRTALGAAGAEAQELPEGEAITLEWWLADTSEKAVRFSNKGAAGTMRSRGAKQKECADHPHRVAGAAPPLPVAAEADKPPLPALLGQLQKSTEDISTSAEELSMVPSSSDGEACNNAEGEYGNPVVEAASIVCEGNPIVEAPSLDLVCGAATNEENPLIELPAAAKMTKLRL